MGNAWVVGIVTGIVSGLLVTWLLRVLISKRKTREYKQQLSSANREVIYSIRAGIPEGNMPSGESLRQ
jgi:Flp pilus assembly protein TadB